MKNLTKNINFVICALALFCGNILFADSAAESVLISDDDFFDEFLKRIEEDEAFDLSELPPSTKGDFSGLSGCLTPDFILELLRDLGIVTGPLWCKTFYPRTPDALYLMPHETQMLWLQGGFVMRPFFHKINSVSMPLMNVLALNFNEELIGEILNMQVAPDADSIFGVIPLLQQISTEERKSGLALQASFKLDRWLLGLETNILLVERNAYASERIKNEILDTFERVFGKVEGDLMFDEVRHFARIRIGLGDTRLRVGYNVFEVDDYLLNVNFSTIFPTGIRGKLLDGRFMSPEDLEQGNSLDFLVRPLRELFLNTRLGNNGHFAIGCCVDQQLSLFDNSLDIRARLAYDRYLPAKECCFMMFKNRLLPQDASLEEFRQQYVIPTAFECTVYPGDVFTFVLGADYHWGDWLLTAGYDFLLQTREDFGKLVNSCVDMSSLRLNDAKQGRIEQNRLTAAVRYTTALDGNDWTFGVGGDWSFETSGIANNWTAYATIGIKF